MEADRALREAAVSKMDSRVIAALSRDAVAAEVHYHRTCYRLYTIPDIEIKASQTSDAIDVYSEIEAMAFNKVCEYIRSDIFQNPRAVFLTELRNILIAHMNMSRNVTITESTKKNFLSKLKTEFKNSIVVISDSNRRIILYPHNLSMTKLVCDMVSIEKELKILKSNEEDNAALLAKAALHLRSDILAHECDNSWPPSLDNISNSENIIPKSVRDFLQMVLTGNQLEKVRTLKTVK